MNQTIIDAIKNRRILSLQYHGFNRLVEPHTYGINKVGHAVLSCYQVAGGSRSNAVPDWKLFLIRDALAISMTDTVFQGVRPGYKRDTKTMQRIYAQL